MSNPFDKPLKKKWVRNSALTQVIMWDNLDCKTDYSKIIVMREFLSKMYLGFLAVQILSAAVGIANTTIDGIIVSNCIGITALGATGVVQPATLAPLALGNVLTMGLYNVVSESIGAKEYLRAGRQLTLIAVVSIIIFIPLSIAFIVFAQPICANLCGSADSKLYQYAVDYTIGIAPSLAFAVILPLFNYVCQMNNKSRWCMVSTAVMLTTNIGGDLLVALCTDWGMLGIGLASSLSTFLAFCVVAPAALNRKNTLRPQGGLTRNESLNSLGRIVSFGAPSALTALSTCISGIFVNTVMVSAGLSAFIAANSCAINVFNILYLTCASLWYCTSTVSSTLYGKRMFDALRQIPAVFTKIVVIGASASAVIGLIFAGPLTGLFLHADPAVQSVAETGVRILTLNLYFNALVTCFQSLFRSTGHRIVAVLLPCIYLLGILCPLSYLFINGFGPLGFFIARVCSYGLGVLIVVVICSIKKKSSPLRPETYLFLPRDDPDAFGEMDIIVKHPDQITDAVDAVSSFYERNDAGKVEKRCVTEAFRELIVGICLKDEVDYMRKRKSEALSNEPSMQCWVHAAKVNGSLSVLTINGHGNASKYFVSEFIEKTRTPLEMLKGERSSMPIIIDGEVHSIDSIYFEFLMLSAIEIKVERE